MVSAVKKMNVVQLTVLTAINMLGSGIVLLPSKLAQVGTISIFSWIVTALGSLALAYAFAKCGRFSRKPGGMGGYAEYAFGRSGNFMSNYTYGVSLLIANVAIAITAVGYATVLFNMTLTPIGVAMATAGLLVLTTVANFGGARITGQIGNVTIWGVVIPVLGVSVLGWFWFDKSLYVAAWNPHDMPLLEAVGASISITLWAFLGLESACANTDAVENPERNVPIAVLGGTLGSAVIYIMSTNVIAGIVPNMDLAASNAPFGLAFATMFTPIVGQIIMGLMVIACIGSLLGWQFTIAQVFKSSADVGYFLKLFAKTTAKDVPIVGMLVLLACQVALTLMTISPDLSKQFDMIVNLAVVTNLVPYLMSMAALMTMQKVAGVTPRDAMFTNAIAYIAAAYSYYALYSAGANAMMLGGIVTMLGWTLYGTVSRRFMTVDAIVVSDPVINADAGTARGQ
ncbi:putrescine transporter [Pseudomonas syringae]|uniref:Putrescine transporter PotE n=1 Tax=Pseudomonas syringae TaxID=317 RepID=A0A1C7YZL1_PSESX|nr:putrescine-ornithine antiporter [Pseudomonas syringae]OCR22256.1 putrescine transporter [Pseudomonas syringae]